jgi:hypothetical protein
MKYKWTVEFEVEECWIKDGFDFTDESALEMLANDLGWAEYHELGAKVIARPDLSKIRNT